MNFWKLVLKRAIWMCVCECVCVWERERERERASVMGWKLASAVVGRRLRLVGFHVGADPTFGSLLLWEAQIPLSKDSFVYLSLPPKRQSFTQCRDTRPFYWGGARKRQVGHLAEAWALLLLMLVVSSLSEMWARWTCWTWIHSIYYVSPECMPCT